MPPTFTRTFDFWFRRAAIGALAAALLALAGLYYYGPQDYTRVGYAPTQPVPFSHAQHAGQLGLSCLYCHTGVEESLGRQDPFHPDVHELPPGDQDR